MEKGANTTDNSNVKTNKRPWLKPPWPKGVSGNPSGRPKGTLKDYVRHKFMGMSEEEKESFLKNISLETQWKMAEGNPESKATVSIDNTNDFTDDELTEAQKILEKRLNPTIERKTPKRSRREKAIDVGLGEVQEVKE